MGRARRSVLRLATTAVVLVAAVLLLVVVVVRGAIREDAPEKPWRPDAAALCEGEVVHNEIYWSRVREQSVLAFRAASRTCSSICPESGPCQPLRTLALIKEAISAPRTPRVETPIPDSAPTVEETQ